MYCGKCGSIIYDGDLFCTKCGAKIGQNKDLNASKSDNLNYEKITLADLGMSIRAYNCLKRAGINNLKQLLEFSTDELEKVRNIGKHSSDEVLNIINIINMHGYDYYLEHVLKSSDLIENNEKKDKLLNEEAFNELYEFLKSDLSRTNDKNLTMKYYKGNNVCTEYYYAIKYVLLKYYDKTDITVYEKEHSNNEEYGSKEEQLLINLMKEYREDILETKIDLVKLYNYIESNKDIKEEVNKAVSFYREHCNEIKNLINRIMKREFYDYLYLKNYGNNYSDNKYNSNSQFLNKILSLDVFNKLYYFLESRESRTDNKELTIKYFKGDIVCIYYYQSIKYVLLKYFNKTELTTYKYNTDGKLNEAAFVLESEVNLLELYDFVEMNYDVKDIVLKGLEYYKKYMFQVKKLNKRLLKKDFDDFLISKYK